jgi:hypothetical protein
LRKRPIVISALCLVLALPSVGLANTNQAQTPPSIEVEAGGQVKAEVKSTSIAALADDFTGPVLEGATIDKTTVEVGESFTITVRATDDLSEVERIEAYLYHDGGHKMIPLVLDTGTGEWKGTYTINEYDRAGTWEVYFDLYDTLGNMTYGFEPELEVVVVNPDGGDTESPTLAAASASPFNVVANQPVQIKATVNDNSEVGSVDAFVSNGEKEYYVPLTLNPGTNEWEGTHAFGEDDKAGSWFVLFVMFDTAGNQTNDYLPGDLVLSNPYGDSTGPSIGQPVFSHTTASPEDTVQITVPVSDEQTGVNYVFAEISHVDSPDDIHYAFGVPGLVEGEWVIDFGIESSFKSGAWNVVIYAVDNAGNDHFEEFDGAFNVENEEVDDIAPVISNVVVTPQGEVQIGDTVTVTAQVSDNVGVFAVYADIYGQEGSELITLNYDEANDQWVGTLPIEETTAPGFYRVSINAIDEGFINSWADAEG